MRTPHPLRTPSRTCLALLLSAAASHATADTVPTATAVEPAPAAETEVLPPKSPQIEIGVHRLDNDTYGVGGLTLEQENTAFRLVVDHSSKAEHILLGGGLRLGDNHHLVGGLSAGREPIPGTTARMKGYSGLLRLSAAQPIHGVRQWFIEGLHQRTQDRLLSVTDTAFSETTSETEGLITTLTHTQGLNRSSTYFYGGRRTELSATVEANAGEQGVAAVRLLHGRTKLLDEKTSYSRVRVTYQRYLPNHDGNWLVGLDNKGLVQLSAQKRLDSIAATLVMQAFKSTQGGSTYGLYAGLRFELGDVPSHPGKRPEENTALLRDTVHAMYAPRNYFGTTLETEERIVTSVTTETQKKEAAATPKKPVAKPVNPPVAPVTPEIDPPPTDIALNQTQVPELDGTVDPANPFWTPTTASTAGTLSCADVALAPNTANTCTFTGGNSLISVASDGTVTFGPGSYTPNSFQIVVTATDQAGNTYTETLTLAFTIFRP